MNLLLIDHGFVEGIMFRSSDHINWKAYGEYSFKRFLVFLITTKGDERRFYDYFFGVN